MWIQFGPPALRWVMFGCFIVLILGMIVMPKEERRRMFRGAHLRRTRRSPSASGDLTVTPAEPWNESVGGAPPHTPIDGPRSLRTVGTFVTAGRLLLATCAVALLLLVAWMAIAFVLNIPGLR